MDAMIRQRNPRVRCAVLEVGDNLELINQLNILEDDGSRYRQSLQTLYTEMRHVTAGNGVYGSTYGRYDRIISPWSDKPIASYRTCVIECEVSRG